MKILICDKLDKITIEELQKLGTCIDVSQDKDKSKKIKENIIDAEIVLVRSDTQINKELLDVSKKLKIRGRSGVGTDNIDIEEASIRNIYVTNTPEANVISAAELTIGLLISAARNIAVANNSVKNNEWERSEFIGVELYKKQLGLIGFGKVAKLVSKRMQSFDMKIVFYDPFIDSSTENEEKVYMYLNEIRTMFPKENLYKTLRALAFRMSPGEKFQSMRCRSAGQTRVSWISYSG